MGESDGGGSFLIRTVKDKPKIITARLLLLLLSVFCCGFLLHSYVLPNGPANSKPFGRFGLRGLSHICINVDDVEEAAEWYARVFDYEYWVGKINGKFIFKNMQNYQICRKIGLDSESAKSCRFDVAWIHHPHMHLTLELFHWLDPVATNNYEQPKPWDKGGIRHISISVGDDAAEIFHRMKNEPGVEMVNKHADYSPDFMSLPKMPWKFFYIIDPFGVQWEFESGDPDVMGGGGMPVVYRW